MNMVSLTNNIEVDEELTQQLLSGVIGKELGLGPAELELGLGVANMKLHSGDPLAALRMYTALVLCAPTNGDYQCGLANCAMQMQEHELALQAASAMIAINPKDCRGYYFSGASCLGMGYYEEAAEDIADALKFAKESNNADILQAAERLSEQLKTRFS